MTGPFTSTPSREAECGLKSNFRSSTVRFRRCWWSASPSRTGMGCETNTTTRARRGDYGWIRLRWPARFSRADAQTTRLRPRNWTDVNSSPCSRAESSGRFSPPKARLCRSDELTWLGILAVGTYCSSHRLLPRHLSFWRTTPKNDTPGIAASGSSLDAFRTVTVTPGSSRIASRPSTVR